MKTLCLQNVKLQKLYWRNIDWPQGFRWLNLCYKSIHLMFYRKIISVISQIHTKHTKALCGQNVELLNVKQAVHTVTTGLWNLNYSLATSAIPNQTIWTEITSKFPHFHSKLLEMLWNCRQYTHAHTHTHTHTQNDFKIILWSYNVLSELPVLELSELEQLCLSVCLCVRLSVQKWTYLEHPVRSIATEREQRVAKPSAQGSVAAITIYCSVRPVAAGCK